MEAPEDIIVKSEREPQQETPAAAPAQEAPKRRSTGNKIFDLVVYPSIAFASVFLFSVWATYQGRYGTGKVRQGYDWLAKKLENTSFLQKIPSAEERFEKAKSYAMVLVSFAAGTLLIAPIKFFEDSRDRLARGFDRMLGKKEENPEDFKKEPKQSWGSVLGGRALTFATVFATALMFGRYIDEHSAGIANKLTGQKIALKDVDRAISSRKWKISFISAFEAFYTAFCAVGVYISSRFLARAFHKKENALGLHSVPVPPHEDEGTKAEAPQQAASPERLPETSWAQDTAKKERNAQRPESHAARHMQEERSAMGVSA